MKEKILCLDYSRKSAMMSMAIFETMTFTVRNMSTYAANLQAITIYLSFRVLITNSNFIKFSAVNADKHVNKRHIYRSEVTPYHSLTFYIQFHLLNMAATVLFEVIASTWYLEPNRLPFRNPVIAAGEGCPAWKSHWSRPPNLPGGHSADVT